MDIVIGIGAMLLGAWLFCGFLTYGMVYAYMQRSFDAKDARKDLYVDMKQALRCIPQGVIGMVRVVDYLIDNDAWDEEDAYPVHGVKFLPFHEHRNEHRY